MVILYVVPVVYVRGTPLIEIVISVDGEPPAPWHVQPSSGTILSFWSHGGPSEKPKAGAIRRIERIETNNKLNLRDIVLGHLWFVIEYFHTSAPKGAVN
jgi:hypothetical protein